MEASLDRAGRSKKGVAQQREPGSLNESPESFFARVRHFKGALFTAQDIAPIIFFRISFGLLMFYELVRYIGQGYVAQNWIGPKIHFKYFGFEWVAAPPGNWMYVLAGALVLCSLGILFGALYRLSATLFFVGFTWFFLIEQSNYLNHFYLISLVSFLAIFLPANRSFAVDARFRPGLRSDVAPVWNVWLLRFQIGVVYFFGGVAKLNSDWLQGEPVRTWLARRAETNILGDLLRTEWYVHLVAYGGVAFDLLIVPFLLWRRTRLVAFLFAIAFHCTNKIMFGIGVFPWLSIALTLLFFPPQVHRRILQRLQQWYFEKPKVNVAAALNQEQFGFRFRKLVIAGISVWVISQTLIPLRHLVYPGNVSWTEEGHRFAWHMMLRTKSGSAEFFMVDPVSGVTERVDPQQHLTERQYRKMVTHPEMILQFAHFLRDDYARRGAGDRAVQAAVYSRLNARDSHLLIDPEVDLAGVTTSWGHASWILPLPNNRIPPTWMNAGASPARISSDEAE